MGDWLGLGFILILIIGAVIWASEALAARDKNE
jgi:hypothetical protein